MTLDYFRRVFGWNRTPSGKPDAPRIVLTDSKVTVVFLDEEEGVFWGAGGYLDKQDAAIQN